MKRLLNCCTSPSQNTNQDIPLASRPVQSPPTKSVSQAPDAAQERTVNNSTQGASCNRSSREQKCSNEAEDGPEPTLDPIFSGDPIEHSENGFGHAKPGAGNPELTADDAVLATTDKSIPEDVVRRNKQESVPRESCWDAAIRALRDSGSEQLVELEKNLRTQATQLAEAQAAKESSDDITAKKVKATQQMAGLSKMANDDIAQVFHDQHDKYYASDGVSPSMGRKTISRIAKSVLQTERLGMALSRIDPYRVAPIALGGVYFVARIVEGNSEAIESALEHCIGIPYLVAMWRCVEEQQIAKNQDESLSGDYQSLEEQLINMYKAVIVLLGTLVKFLKSKRNQASSVLVPAQIEWSSLKKRIDNQEKICDTIKKTITTKKERRTEIKTRLDWISSHDHFKDYKDAQQRTGAESSYASRCQWFIDHPVFKKWYEPGHSRALWLKGTIGTGKTALMGRAMNDMRQYLETGKLNGSSAIFFFRKATASNGIDVNTCLRSLIRQLCWDDAALMLHPAVEREYQECERRHRLNSPLTTTDSLKLLVEMLAEKEAYIMIDGIDECDGAPELMQKLHELFRKLQELTRALENVPSRPSRLHIMLSGRSDSPIVSDYFEKCSIIETGSRVSSKDHAFYVETEIKKMRLTKPRSDFVRSDKDFPGRLESILKRDGRGLFRWTEIQLAFYSETEFAGGDDDIEEEMDTLEKRMTSEELNKRKGEVLNFEYDRLLSRLRRSNVNYERAIKMLKLLACSCENLSFDDLVHAIISDEAERNKSKVTEKIVRQILVGFVTSRVRLSWRRTETLEFGHASVLEYLQTTQKILGGFSVEGQNSQTALLCFASIKLDLTGLPLAAGNIPLFTEYSIEYWVTHCRRVLRKHMDENLLGKICDFITNHPYLSWKEAIGLDWFGQVLSRLHSHPPALLRTSKNKSPRPIEYVTNHPSEMERALYDSLVPWSRAYRLSPSQKGELVRARIRIPAPLTFHYLINLPAFEEIILPSVEETYSCNGLCLGAHAAHIRFVPLMLLIYRHCLIAGHYDVNRQGRKRLLSGINFLALMSKKLVVTMDSFVERGAWIFTTPWLKEGVKCLLSFGSWLWYKNSCWQTEELEHAKRKGSPRLENGENFSHYKLGIDYAELEDAPGALVYLLARRLDFLYHEEHGVDTGEWDLIGDEFSIWGLTDRDL